jgi:hypothetical protein
MSLINDGFPREVIRYQTSDGMCFPTFQNAQEWQDILNKRDLNTYYAVHNLPESDKAWLENNPKDYWAHKNKNA